MALYITISLLAVLAAVPDGDRSSIVVLGLIWGTATGLTLAHLLAFRLSARLVSAGRLEPHERMAIGAQALASASVAALASLPLLLAAGNAGLEVSRMLLAGFVGLCAYGAGRQSGGTRRRAVIYAAGTVAVAVAVALVKNALTGH